MKKVWETPKLVVLHRGKMQEAVVLGDCKGTSGSQTTAYESNCKNDSIHTCDSPCE